MAAFMNEDRHTMDSNSFFISQCYYSRHQYERRKCFACYSDVESTVSILTLALHLYVDL
jgi:hypothetical protein